MAGRIEYARLFLYTGMKRVTFKEWLEKREGKVKIAGKPVRRLPPPKPGEDSVKTVDGLHQYKPMSELPPGL